MADYTFTEAADADFENIAETSLQNWGLTRAETYIQGLKTTFRQLAAFPNLGRDASHIGPGLLRMASASHVIFYRITANGILIIRILHERMDFLPHLQ